VGVADAFTVLRLGGSMKRDSPYDTAGPRLAAYRGAVTPGGSCMAQL